MVTLSTSEARARLYKVLAVPVIFVSAARAVGEPGWDVVYQARNHPRKSTPACGEPKDAGFWGYPCQVINLRDNITHVAGAHWSVPSRLLRGTR